ncbi:hypothetical protein GALMADRAFT_37981, partial [Galerina marginata CBS 339.88]
MDTWTVALLGDAGVGKTTLALQVFPNMYDQTYDPNLDDGPYRKKLIVDNKMCFIEVIDTRGSEDYDNLRDEWIREAQGFVLIYSVASRSSFDQVEKFHQCMGRICQESPIFVLVSNKCDKAYEREVSKEEGSTLASQLGCEFIETSAKTAQNVDRMFLNLIRLLRRS